MKGFLYGQTEYNLLHNVNRIDEYIEYAKKYSFDFLSITDNNLCGHYKFYKKCRDASILPIIGLEYSYKKITQPTSKVLLYARNNDGYKALLKISSLVSINKIDTLEAIFEYIDDLNVVFVFNNSYMERMLISNDYSLLDEQIEILKTFPHVYMGISYTNQFNKIDLNKRMEEYVSKKGIICLPIHQCKYLLNEDIPVYEACCKIGNNPETILEYEDYSFESDPLPNKQIDEFISSIHLDLFHEKIALPKYPNTKGASSKDFLSALCYKGLEKRKCMVEPYLKRLSYELSVIDSMGYNDYFLIVWDFIKYAKQKQILVGPGRGSAAGSLVAYTLGITEVDPIRYDLLFERFLNPERVSMPDIDTDFPDVSRDEIIEYVKQFYGEKHVCNISAYGTFLTKSAIRDLARINKMENSRVEKIIEMVEKYSFEKLLAEYKDNELYDFLYVASRLIGLPRHISTHAAGIILSDSPLDEIVPLQDGINGLYQSQLEASDLEKIGLLKMDFLGIRNLTLIKGMMDTIGFDAKKLKSIPLNDPKVFQMLQSGDTLGIFQLESSGIRNVLLKLKPTNFEDLVAVLALYRPGPMDNIDEYIVRKHQKNFHYIHPDLEPILNKTYGIIVYQEQIMKIVQVFAGYTLGEADVLRRAVSKKDEETLLHLKSDFISRTEHNGYTNEVAEKIYALILKFANYGFNRSHSVAYAMISYQMAYIKANYFQAFIANILNNSIGSGQTMSEYIQYAKENGVAIQKPNINISMSKFILSKSGIVMPLTAISSIGDTISSRIIEERTQNGNFKSFENFKERCSFINENSLEALIYSGALDSFGKTKKSMCNIVSKEDEIFLKHMSGVIEDSKDFEVDHLRAMELKYLGMNLEYSIFKNFEFLSKKYKTIPIRHAKYNDISRFLVLITDFKEITTKRNDKMVLGKMEDVSVKRKFVIFPRVYLGLQEPLEIGKLYLIQAILEKDQKNEDCLTVQRIAKVA